MTHLFSIDDVLEIASTAFIAPGAQLVGRVAVGDESSVWFNAVLRGDTDFIQVGRRTSIQDGTVIHCDDGYPTIVGDDVTVGHAAILHGTKIGNGVLVGMGACLLSGSEVGEGSFLAARTLVREGMKIPPRSLVMGIPGKIVREVDDELYERIQIGARHYVESAALYLKRFGAWKNRAGQGI